MVAPTGGRYWRYNYRFDGKQKTIALGVYPDVSLDLARARHEAAPAPACSRRGSSAEETRPTNCAEPPIPSERGLRPPDGVA